MYWLLARESPKNSSYNVKTKQVLNFQYVKSVLTDNEKCDTEIRSGLPPRYRPGCLTWVIFQNNMAVSPFFFCWFIKYKAWEPIMVEVYWIKSVIKMKLEMVESDEHEKKEYKEWPLKRTPCFHWVGVYVYYRTHLLKSQLLRN